MRWNSVNIFLLIALIALPIAGLMLHTRIHPTYTYLTYILLFDIIIITLLYLSDRTRFIGFILNTVFFLVGVIMHIMYVPGEGLSDILISIPDFVIGYALWEWGMNNPAQKEATQQIKRKK